MGATGTMRLKRKYNDRKKQQGQPFQLVLFFYIKPADFKEVVTLVISSWVILS